MNPKDKLVTWEEYHDLAGALGAIRLVMENVPIRHTERREYTEEEKKGFIWRNLNWGQARITEVIERIQKETGVLI